MAIERSKRPIASARMARTARSLLDASTLCAIATVGSDDRAHVNTAYHFRPRRLKLFDEQELGPGWFVTARVAAGGRLEWERTEIYRSAA